MSNTLQKLRGTGRTTRLLEHAKKLAREGRAVYVIADNTRDMRRLEILCGEPNLGIKFETPDSPGNFVWEEMRLRGAHPNCVVLVDHHAIEDRFARVLEMLHAYDEPSAEESNADDEPRARRENRMTPTPANTIPTKDGPPCSLALASGWAFVW